MAASKKTTHFPIKTKQVCVDVNGINTDVICRNFEDHIFIVVTQFQKLGTLVQVSRDVMVAEDNQVTYSTRVLLGEDEPITHVIARNIAVAIGVNKSILLGLALKDLNRETTKAIEETILKTKVWD